MADTGNEHPFSESAAARMLAEAIRRKQAAGFSLRRLAPTLGYKQSTVLSHMANGRIPIPMARAKEIAAVMGIPQSEFLIAVMEQREPEASTMLMAGPIDLARSPQSFAEELEEIAGRSLEHLTSEQKDVMRKVAVDPSPARRWLAEAEISAMGLLRSLRPEVSHTGLSRSDREEISKALHQQLDR
ncbi:hypothetical protein ABS767_06025 [Sphingomonas sp. ST-64]|uniref:HTH cro/C1-type domain-containing protein n=1 Tax=Sphingomonas plantiphila TaxID=3163295 RepID=A0ABW8YJP6_9SPHN